MNFNRILFFCLAVTAGLSYEKLALVTDPHQSVLNFIIHYGYGFERVNINSSPGGIYGLALGWSGLSLMIAMNVYTARKYYSFGPSIAVWLNFHILCGILGPVFILFHSDFHARGVVAISFWSMVICVLSGLVGRFLYSTTVRDRKMVEALIEKQSMKFHELAGGDGFFDPQSLALAKENALEFSGVLPAIKGESLIKIIFYSVVGDLRLLFFLPPGNTGMSVKTRKALRDFVIAKRHLVFSEPYQKALGFWHSFHLPFAAFMYLTALLHVGAELLFRSGN